jgi:phosphoenolpyruvate-protein kinase (PTS system EI component)
VTGDGRVVPVLANVGSLQDAQVAMSEGADGVGMLRTEFAFLDRKEPPGEEEQYLAYRAVADAIGERPLVVRTLDLGADVPAWDAQQEANPALGNRGIRLTLSSRHLLETQLRAVARLAEDRAIGLMFPMVTTVDELRAAKACLAEVAEAAGSSAAAGEVEIGITVEVPAAAVTAKAFAPLVDFFAIGTNDLTQYTLAADRGNAAVAALADGLHPAVLRLIGEVTAAGEPDWREVCVVGELGSDPLAIPLLLGLGVTTLSVRPNAVAPVKQVVRAVDLDQARALAHAALEAESATAVRQLASAGG